MQRAKKKPEKPAAVESAAAVRPALMGIKDAARYLDVAVVTLRRYTHAGEIPHVRVGHLIKYRIADLDQWIEDRTTTKWEAQGR